MVWQGLNLQIGAIAVATDDESVRLNPTPVISYSLFFREATSDV